MGVVGSTSSEATVTLSPNVNPLTQREATDPSANTESVITLRTGVKLFKMVNRGSHAIKLAYAESTSSTQYWTLFPNAVYIAENIGVSTLSLYVQSTGISQPIEIESWT